MRLKIPAYPQGNDSPQQLELRKDFLNKEGNSVLRRRFYKQSILLFQINKKKEAAYGAYKK